MSEFEPLPPDVEALLASERAVAAAPPGLANEVWGAVSASMANASVGLGASAVATSGAFAKGKVFIALAAFIAGGGVVAVADRTVWRAQTFEVTPATALPTPTVLVQPVIDPPAPPVDQPLQAPAVVRPTAHAPQLESRAAQLDRERGLIDQARAALARGNANDALSALEQHRRAFTKGQLAEDRDGLEVFALRAAGRAQDAREKLEAFKRRWPNSMLLPSLENE